MTKTKPSGPDRAPAAEDLQQRIAELEALLAKNQEALRESESRFKIMTENMSDMIRLTDVSGVNVYVSPSHKKNLGYSPEERTGRSIMEFIHPDDLERVLTVFYTSIANHVPGKAEYRFRHADGHYLWLETIGDVILDEAGNVAGGIFCSRNITDRKKAEDAARQSEDRFTKAFHSMPAPTMMSTIDEGRYLDVNDSCLAMLGYSREEMTNQTMGTGSIWVDPEKRPPLIKKLLKQHFLRDELICLRTRSGDIRSVLWSAELIQFQGRQVILSLIQDITERERMARELNESREQLRALAANLESLREEERTSLSREIHDEFGQSLTGLKMDLAWLTRRLPQDQELLIEKAKSMQRTIDDNINLIRNIATRLRPGILDDFGLLAAMEWQAADFDHRTGIQCRVTSNVKAIDLNGDKASSLFRVFQEALTNVARHSQATSVDVDLKKSRHKLTMRIHDNGIGLDEKKLNGRKSLGILGIRERITLLHGQFIIQGVPGEGTTITISIPV